MNGEPLPPGGDVASLPGSARRCAYRAANAARVRTLHAPADAGRVRLGSPGPDGAPGRDAQVAGRSGAGLQARFSSPPTAITSTAPITLHA